MDSVVRGDVTACHIDGPPKLGAKIVQLCERGVKLVKRDALAPKFRG